MRDEIWKTDLVLRGFRQFYGKESNVLVVNGWTKRSYIYVFLFFIYI